MNFANMGLNGMNSLALGFLGDSPTVGNGIVETTWEANSTFFDENQLISVDFHNFQDFLTRSAYRTRSRDFDIEFCLTKH